jgi:serine/threonine-protein kinase
MGDTTRAAKAGSSEPTARDPLSADRWASVAELFDALVDLPPSQRATALDARCMGDAELRAEVEALLASSERADGFMQASAHDYMASLLQSDDVLVEPPAPDRVGPFRIVREIGRGGMGTVYLAERDDAQFTQAVALKVVRSAFSDPRLVRRFVDERQILAWLTHPNIAQLVDGGVTDDGVPWFAMEYVEGTPIDRYCDEQRLTIERRLALFGQVCDAVGHAHRKLVVHRDLKPGNILVTRDGQVKLLDFGIAKLLERPGDATDAPPETRTTRYLTPEYASPEQLRGGPVSTATDVYALGVLLCCLLSGEHPHRDAGASLAAWARRFSELPPAPSALLDGSASSRAASVRHLTTSQLRRRVRGDLDAITLKALEPEPEDRYRSIEQLASDVQRHLRGLTVSARSASHGYALRTFVRRHRVSVGGAVALLVLTLSFTVVTAIQSRRISADALRIATERDKAQQVASFLVDLFGEADPYRPRAATPSVREVLDRGAERVERELGRQPAVRAEMLYVMAQAYFGLGDLGRSAQLLESAAQLQRARAPESKELADVLNYLAQVRHYQRQTTAAESLYREALRQRRRLLPPDDPAIMRTLSGLGAALQATGRHADAEATLRNALALERARQPANPLGVAQVLRKLGHLLRDRTRYTEAEAVYRETLAIYERELGTDNPESASSRINLGNVLFRQGRLAEAEPLIREGVGISARTLGERHWDVLIDRLTLADVLTARGELAEADSIYAATLAVHRETMPRNDRQIGDDLFGYGRLRLVAGDSAGARRLLQEAASIYRASPLERDARLAMAESLLAGPLRPR